MPLISSQEAEAAAAEGGGAQIDAVVVSINKTGTVGKTDTLKIRKHQAGLSQNQQYKAPEYVVNSLRRKKKPGELTLSLPADSSTIDTVNQQNAAQHDQGSSSSSPAAVKKASDQGGSSSLQAESASSAGQTARALPGVYTEGMNMPAFDNLPDDFEEDIEDISLFRFEEYAMANFQGQVSPSYERRVLREPLLKQEVLGDQLAAMAVWITILRFMGDLPDARSEALSKEYVPVMLKIYQTLGHIYKEEDLLATQQTEIHWGDKSNENNNVAKPDVSKKGKGSKKLLPRFGKGKSQSSSDGGIKFSSYLEGGNPMLEKRETTDLEKVQFIIGNGLLRPQLRDEILCQVCKQLSGNPSKQSCRRGWVLLALCLSCFAPSLDLLNYVCCFIDEGHEDFADYVAEKLDRTLMNGPRKEPPCWLELEAAERGPNQRCLTVRISLPDGNTKALLVDSASTAADVTHLLTEKLGIMDHIGFSVFISLHDKVMSLGSGTEHIFDAICQAEQLSMEAGIPVEQTPWRLAFRKETFTPWYDPKEDPVGTNLIYHQVLRGIKNGDFPVSKDDDLVMITATQYYIDFGHTLKLDRLQNMLPLYLPPSMLKDNLDEWIKKVTIAHTNCNYVKRDIPVMKAKADVVGYAKHKWPMAFTSFYEAYKYTGPRLPENDVVIGVNAGGIFIFTYDGKLMVHWTFPEIATIYGSRAAKMHGQSVTIVTIHREEYTFTSPDAVHVRQLMNLFLKGLRKRSRYLMVLQGSSKAGNPSHLTFMKGDVIKIDREHEKAMMNSGWCNGENLRTKARGEFRAEGVYVLPAIKEPSRKMMKLIAEYVNSQPKDWLAAQGHSEEDKKAASTERPQPERPPRDKRASVA